MPNVSDKNRKRGTRPGLTREQSRALTREKLLNAARMEFAAHGLQGANLTDILKQAEVSPGAFYHHFPDKLDLFLAVVDQMSDGFRDMLRNSEHMLNQPKGDLVEWVAALFRFTLQVTRENRELFIIYVREIHSGNARITEFFDRDTRSFRGEMAQMIEKLVSRGLLPDIDIDWAAYLIGMLAQGGMMYQLAEAADEESWSRAMAQFTLGGVPAVRSQKARPPRVG